MVSTQPISRPCLDCGRLCGGTRCRPCHRARRKATYEHPDYVALGRPTGPCHLRTPVCTGRAVSWHHIMPMAKGGGHERSNVIEACIECNSSVRDRGSRGG